MEAAWAASGRVSNRLRVGTIRRSMNLSWFGDWRFDMRRRLVFHETRRIAGRLAATKTLIIKDQPVQLHGK
ncbi:hypothetical protein BR1R5_19500 [Pseudomonas sp. BR1R-5]|nr:hypothetical protein BR1R5_19500 [Pseudomonas sp. BR1R-5]